MITLKFLVVLFKMQPCASTSIQSILQQAGDVSDDELIVWDNSPQSQAGSIEQLLAAHQLQYRYISTPENNSLSSIYNDVALGIKDDEYLTVLDQDSVLPSEYFDELRQAQKNGHPLILPKVRCGNILVSPGKRFFCKGRLLDDIQGGIAKSKNLLAINSGMSIRGSVLRKIRYDERLRFYGTDTYFMKRYEKHFSHVYVMNSIINHSLAENDVTVSSDRRLQIERARHQAWEIIFSETLTERMFLWLYQRAISLKKKIFR